MTEEDAPEPRQPLPKRPPRPMVVHFGVDAAVAFLALIVLGLIVGLKWQSVALLAIAIGALAAPFTRRAEERALAARESSGDGD